MNVLIMMQVSRYGWQIVSKSGNIVQKDIYLDNLEKAKEYIKNYTSSFSSSWTYELISLDKNLL